SPPPNARLVTASCYQRILRVWRFGGETRPDQPARTPALRRHQAKAIGMINAYREDGIETREQSGGLAQIIAALSLFVALYLATFFVAGYVSAAAGAYFNQWVSLLSVCAATYGTIAIIEHGVWGLGIFVPPRLAMREMLLGCGAAVLLIGAA